MAAVESFLQSGHSHSIKKADFSNILLLFSKENPYKVFPAHKDPIYIKLKPMGYFIKCSLLIKKISLGATLNWDTHVKICGV